MSRFEFAKLAQSTVSSLVRTFCILIAATGLFVVVLSACCLIAMLIVWSREPHLQSDDKKIIAWASVWLVTAGFAVISSWWLRGRTFPAGHPARSLRLVASNPGRTEQIVHVWSELGLFAIAAAWIWASCLAGSGLKLLVLVLSLTGLYLAMCARILVHELGHLMAAKAVGLNQRRLQVGAGPLIWSRLFPSGLRFEWRMFARGGWVLALPASENNFRVRQLLFVSAGPLIDLLLICSLFVGLTKLCGSLTEAFGHGVAGIITFVLFWWTVISAVSGLIPHRVNISGRKLWTDGYWILLLCTASRSRISELVRGGNPEKLLELLESEDLASEVRVIDKDFGAGASEPSRHFREQQARLAGRLRPIS